MVQTLQGQIEVLRQDDTFKRMPADLRQRYLTEEVIPYYEPSFTGFTPEQKQGYLNEEILPALQIDQAPPPTQQANPALDFLGQVANTAIQTGSFGIVDRPDPTNEWAGALGGLIGGAIPVGGATLLGGFPAGIVAAAALGGGTSIRDQYDEGKTDINIPRVLASTAAGGLGQFAGGRFGTTLIKDALINAGFNAGEVAGIQALEGMPTDMGQILKAAGIGVGATAGGRGAAALLSKRSKAQAPSQATQEQPKSMLEQAEPPKGQVYSSDGMSNRALERVTNASKLGNEDDVVKAAKSERGKLFESLLRLEAQNRQDTPQYDARRKAMNALDRFIEKPSKKGFVANVRPHTKEPSYVATPAPAKPKAQRQIDIEALRAKERAETARLKAEAQKAKPKPSPVYIEPIKPAPAKPKPSVDLEALRAKEKADASKLKTPQEAARRIAQQEQAKQVQATLLKQPIGQLPAKPIQALPSMTQGQQAKVQARVKQGGTVLPPSQEVIDVKGKRLIPQPTQGNVPKAMTGKPAEQAKANAVARERATQEAQGFATVLKQADAVPDDASRLRAYKKLRTQAQNKLIADPTNTLAKQRLETVQGRIDAMTETASNKQAAQAQLAQKAKIKPATVDDTTAKVKEPAKITPKEAGQLLTELYSGDHVGVVDNQTAYEVFEMLGVPVKKVHRDNITSADVTRFGNQLVFNANLGRQLGTQRIGENETLGGVITRLQKQYPNLNVASIIGGRVVRDPNVLASIGEDVAAVQKAGESLPDNLVSALERGGLTEQAKRDAQMAVPYEKLEKYKKTGFQNMDRAQTPQALDAAFEEFNTQWKTLESDFKALKDEKAWMDVYEQASERWEANSNILKEAEAFGAKPVEPVASKPKAKPQPAKAAEPAKPVAVSEAKTVTQPIEPAKAKPKAQPKPKPKNPLEVQRTPEQPMTPANAKVIGEVAMMNKPQFNIFKNEAFAKQMRETDTPLAKAWLKQNEITTKLYQDLMPIDESSNNTRNFKFGELAYEKGFKDPALEAKFLAEKAERERLKALKPQLETEIKKLMIVTDNVLLEKAGAIAKVAEPVKPVAKAEPKAVDKPVETPKAKFIPQATDEGKLGTRYTTPNPDITVRKGVKGNWVVETKQPDGKYGNGVRVADEATAKAYVAKADVLAKTVEVKAKIQDPVNPAKIHANASKVDQLLPLVPDDKKPLVKAFFKAVADGKLIDVETFAEKFGLTVGDDPKDRLDYPYDADVNPKTGDILLRGIKQTDGQRRTRLLKEGQLGFVERKGVMQIPKDTEVKSEITSIKPSDKEVMYRPSYEPDADGKPQLVVKDRDGNIVEQVEAKSVPISGWLADRLTRPEPFEKADIRRAGEEIANMPDLRQVEEVMAKFPEAQRDALRKLVTGLRCQK